LANLTLIFARQIKGAGQNYVQQARNIWQVQDAATIENLKQVFGYDNFANIPARRGIMSH
jgi:hypothetical protein